MSGQVERVDVIGDLARDMRGDRNWPAGPEKRDRLRDYLAGRQADESMLAAFDAAWKEYEASRDPR
jgi:uncharacterized protein YozE (UPF0346 family)